MASSIVTFLGVKTFVLEELQAYGYLMNCQQDATQVEPQPIPNAIETSVVDRLAVDLAAKSPVEERRCNHRYKNK